jgi:F-type H+-transporting ATPase subunit a
MASGSILKSKFFNILLICAFFLAAGLFPKPVSAQESKENKFDAKKTILEHISDSHSWPFNFPFVKEKHIPLPIILYTDKGFEIFSSAKVTTEDTTKDKGIYQGAYHNYKLAENKIVVLNALGSIDEAASKKVMDFSITRNVASMFMAMAILLIVFLSVACSLQKTREGKAPKGLQSFLRTAHIVFVRDDIAHAKYGYQTCIGLCLCCLTVFFFILIQ